MSAPPQGEPERPDEIHDPRWQQDQAPEEDRHRPFAAHASAASARSGMPSSTTARASRFRCPKTRLRDPSRPERSGRPWLAARVRFQYALRRSWVFDEHCRRPHRPTHELTSAVWTAPAGQASGHAVGAEGALESAYHGIARVRRQVLVAALAVGLEFEHRHPRLRARNLAAPASRGKQQRPSPDASPRGTIDAAVSRRILR